jgi:alcohol dehydrogenase class IV
MIRMDEKILQMLPKMFFPGVVFTGKNALFYLRAMRGKTIAVISKSVWKHHEDRIRRFLPKDCKTFFHSGEPCAGDVKRLEAEIAKDKYENIVGIGGGTVMDLSKSVRETGPAPKLVLIPTTSGTGAEVSRYAVITEKGEKKPRESDGFIPHAVLLDPSFSSTLPRFDTVYNNLDILSSAIEALISKKANPLSDALSVMCIDSVIEGLRKICEDTGDAGAREKLQIAGFLNGLVLGSSSVGFVHAFAHYFGAKMHLRHGTAIGTFLLPVTNHGMNKTDMYGKFQKSVHLRGDSLKKLEEFMKEMQFLDYHKKLDFSKIDFKDACEKITADPMVKTNPYRVTEEDCESILGSMGVLK